MCSVLVNLTFGLLPCFSRRLIGPPYFSLQQRGASPDWAVAPAAALTLTAVGQFGAGVLVALNSALVAARGGGGGGGGGGPKGGPGGGYDGPKGVRHHPKLALRYDRDVQRPSVGPKPTTTSAARHARACLALGAASAAPAVYAPSLQRVRRSASASAMMNRR
jgi:hypothetical protein